MKREKLLILSVALLLILNFGTLGYLFLRDGNGPGHRRSNPVDAIIIKTLQYDRQQQAAFDILKHEHHGQMMQLDGKYAAALKGYFRTLGDSAPTAARDSFERVFCAIQTEKARITYAHFEDLKALCRPGQKARFDELIPELVQIIVPERNIPPQRRD
jgi:protein CpxP